MPFLLAPDLLPISIFSVRSFIILWTLIAQIVFTVWQYGDINPEAASSQARIKLAIYFTIVNAANFIAWFLLLCGTARDLTTDAYEDE